MSVDPATSPLLPLAGVRVLDFSMVWSGPLCTRVLADMGAEVIKVEACQRPDPVRYQIPAENEPGQRPWERGWWNGLNRNKLGLTLNLSTPEGVGLARELASISDVVVENFSPRVMKNLGLDYDAVRRVRPDLIMLSLSGFGQTGPYGNYMAYGHVLEHMSGVSSITGYPDGIPSVVDSTVSDPLSGIMGAGAVLTALVQRGRTGQGQHIDLSELETLLFTIGEVVLDFTVNGRVQTRQGNRSEGKAPHGVYRCRGDDRWVAISIGGDEEWRRLCHAMGEAALAADPRFAALAGRQAHHAELDALIEQWTAAREPMEAAEALQRAGIAAGPVLSPRETLSDPHYRARGSFQPWDLPQAGRRLLPGPLFRLSGVPEGVRQHAPGLGEHSRRVLGELLGISQDALEELQTKETIGTEPIPNIPPAGAPISSLQQVGVIADIDPDYKRRLGLDRSDEQPS